MSYADGEALIVKRIRACHGFNSGNISQADWKVLNAGKSDHYAILKPGGGSLEWKSPNLHQITWVTTVEIWQRYVDDSKTALNLYGYFNDILAMLAYPLLGDTTGAVADSSIGDIGPVEEIIGTGGGPDWLRWSIPVVWQEQTIVTFEE